MKLRKKSDSTIHIDSFSLPDVDSHSVSRDDYSHTPDPPHKIMRSWWNTASLVALKSAVLRERQICPPSLNGLRTGGQYVLTPSYPF